MGDKSQLVCMALAARYRPWPVLLGVLLAFGLLNLLAVMFGAAAALWIPEKIVIAAVGVLFLLFGVLALRHSAEEQDDIPDESSVHGIFVSAFLLILVAEFGDKTQLSVAGLSSTVNPLAVWTGATLALLATSGLAVWAGRRILQRISLALVHRLSGALFILLGVLAFLKLVFLM